ncbi:uncharacterized protein KIAA0513-like [Liolophura sinensis]|uniref:uncharacterized protein KIAA0513-like n=1 Tax=Liolophura sinensis TaxID=3198878 RepID=UPI003158CDCD
MDIGRRRRKDSDGSSDERRSLSESFSEGTSKFFSSVIAKKNGLFSDISSKFETTFLKTSSSESSLDGGNEDMSTTPQTYNDNTGSSKPKVRPGSAGQKKFGPRPNRNGPRNEGEKKVIHPPNEMTNCRGDWQGDISSTAGTYPDSGVEIPAGINMSFDEPLYNGRGSDSLVSSRKDSYPKASDSEAVVSPPWENGQHTQGAGSYDLSSQSGQSTSSGEPDTSLSNYPQDSADVHVDKRKGKFTKLRRRSSTVDEMLFDDFVEDEVVEEVEVFPDGTEVETNKPIKTLLPFGTTPGLPAVPSQSSFESASEQELKGYFSTSVDSSDAEFGGVVFHRSTSMGSEKSWSSTFSTDSQPDEVTRECMSFMKSFVEKIFNPEEEISQTLKAKFGEMTQESPGRLWFARYVNTQRVNSKNVDERIFFRLVQYFALVLFECNEAEDFSPAKSLMNMCFTFYHEGKSSNGKKMKFFLYSYLKDQPIWQSIRFWSAAFFDAVQCERARKPVCTSEDGNDERTDDRQFQENITFGQLGTFTCNMRAFGLSRELCLEFLRKQCTIANLREEQVQMLKDNVEKWKDAH